MNLVTDEQKVSLALALRVDIPENAVVCYRHYENHFEGQYFPAGQCCNPFQKHDKRPSESFADEGLVKKLKSLGLVIRVGSELCRECIDEANDIESSQQSQGSSSDNQSTPTSGTPLSGNTRRFEAFQELNPILAAAKLPLLEPSVYEERKKVNLAHKTYQQVKETVKPLIYTALDVEESEVSDTEDNKTRKEDWDSTVESLKIKVSSVSNLSEKLKLLTFAPPSWSAKTIADYFKVSNYLAKKAISLRKKSGIFPHNKPKRGHRISENVLRLVHDFYNDSEFSRECPNAGEVVSVRYGSGVYKQKRLLLLNLNELYEEFKKKYPDAKIGRSRFCAERPKWCVPPGSSGTHAVCVCKYHENFKLLLDAVGEGPKAYKDYIKMSVCDDNGRDCMLRLCGQCPKEVDIRSQVSKKLSDVLFLSDEQESAQATEECTEEEYAEAAAEDFSVKFKQWSGTDRPTLETHEAPIDDFVDTFTAQLIQLIPHSYYTKQQSAYLKEQKSKLHPGKAVVLMDFSENYSYTIQDEIQSHHFAKASCSLHPVVIYYHDGRELKHKSLDFLSEDMKHDVAFVDTVQEKTVFWIKEHCPDVSEIEYFTDGCAAQYKNCRSFLNLCKHEEKYGIKATWSFFATSHGKSPTDGVGACDKKGLKMESLRRVKNHQSPINNITAVMEFFKAREEKGGEITHIHIEKDYIEASRKTIAGMKPRSVQGTRTFHCIHPLTNSRIGCKRTSFDADFSLCFDLNAPAADSSWEEDNYVAFLVDRKWQIGYIVRLTDQDEAEVQFLVPVPKEKKKYDWLDSNCHAIPLSNILCYVELEISENELLLKTSVRTINAKLKQACSRK